MRNVEPTHREIFSKSYWIKLKSDCIYHIPNQLENGKYNLISVSFDKISKILSQINPNLVGSNRMRNVEPEFPTSGARRWPSIRSNLEQQKKKLTNVQKKSIIKKNDCKILQIALYYIIRL